MDWHAYITENPYAAIQQHPLYQRYRVLLEQLQTVSSFRHGDLRYLNVAKQIIQERTQPVAIRRGHPPYCFRFQCLTTGRVSMFIKESDYPRFGITRQDAQNGTGYGLRAEIPDKMKPLIDAILSRVTDLGRQIFGETPNLWWQRYNEYLQSEEWASKRRAVLERDGWRCALTGAAFRLQVHHLNYQNVGNENLEDLVTLTEAVHEAIHDQEHPQHREYWGKLMGMCKVSP